MDCFLTNSKKRKVEITNNEKSKAYQTEKRKRVFIPSWTTTYPSLQNGISAGFAKLHVGLVVLVKRLSVLINFLLQNTKLVSVLGKICPNFAGHV